MDLRGNQGLFHWYKRFGNQSQANGSFIGLLMGILVEIAMKQPGGGVLAAFNGGEWHAGSYHWASAHVPQCYHGAVSLRHLAFQPCMLGPF